MKSLSDEVKISTAITPAAGVAGTDDINGTIVDMNRWRGLLAIIRFGAITGNAVTSIKMQHGDESDLSDAEDLEGSGQTIADSDDNETFYIDLVEPVKRYARIVVERATQNAVVASANYLQYNGAMIPVSAHGTGVSGEKVVPTLAGTA